VDGDGFSADRESLSDLPCSYCVVPAFAGKNWKSFRPALGREFVIKRTDHIWAGARRCAYRIWRKMRPKRLTG